MEVVEVGLARQGFRGGLTERDTTVEEVAALDKDMAAIEMALPQ